MECLGFVNDFIDGMPAVGHVKGGIHYACGDREGGDKAMKSASRTVGVMGGGTIGFLVGGPVGAAAGGIAGGAALDGLTTGIDSAVHKEYRPSGMVSQATNIVKDPTNPGLWFDTMAIPVFDAMAGVSAGKGAAKLAKKLEKRLTYNQNKAAIVKKVGKPAYKDISKTADVARKHMRKGDIKHNIPQVVTGAKDLATNESHFGANKQLRQNIRRARKGMTRSQAKKNSIFKNSKSNVQKRVPSAKNVIGRDPKACAEHAALHKLYEKRPSAKPKEIRTTTVKANPKKGTITALKRCENCLQYDPFMGSVPTDKIHGMPILENPGCPVSKSGAALIGASVASSAIKQRSKAYHSATQSTKGAKTSNETKSSKETSSGDKQAHQISATKIEYVRSHKLHKRKSKDGKAKVKQRLLCEAAKPRILNGDTVSHTGSDGEETAEEFEIDEDKENIHHVMLVKKLR